MIRSQHLILIRNSCNKGVIIRDIGAMAWFSLMLFFFYCEIEFDSVTESDCSPVSLLKHLDAVKISSAFITHCLRTEEEERRRMRKSHSVLTVTPEDVSETDTLYSVSMTHDSWDNCIWRTFNTISIIKPVISDVGIVMIWNKGILEYQWHWTEW